MSRGHGMMWHDLKQAARPSSDSHVLVKTKKNNETLQMRAADTLSQSLGGLMPVVTNA